jgi:hypothetical protein
VSEGAFSLDGKVVTHVDTLVGEAWWHGGRVFFGFGEEDGELFDGGHGNVTSVVTGEKGLRRESQISLTRFMVRFDDQRRCTAALAVTRRNAPCPSGPERRVLTPWLAMYGCCEEGGFGRKEKGE